MIEQREFQKTSTRRRLLSQIVYGGGSVGLLAIFLSEIQGEQVITDLNDSTGMCDEVSQTQPDPEGQPVLSNNNTTDYSSDIHHPDLDVVNDRKVLRRDSMVTAYGVAAAIPGLLGIIKDLILMDYSNR